MFLLLSIWDLTIHTSNILLLPILVLNPAYSNISTTSNHHEALQHTDSPSYLTTLPHLLRNIWELSP
jgi:hypothetical protein